MSWKCNNCGCRFEEPVTTYEGRGPYGPPYEQIYVCPECKVDDMMAIDDYDYGEDDDDLTEEDDEDE